jgi:hypothetical protein
MKSVAEMSEQEKAQTRAWMKTWQKAGPVLEEIRTAEIRATNTADAMEVLDGMFTHAVKTVPVRASSGLVEQQLIFRRAKK